MSLTRKSVSGTKKAFVGLEEAPVQTLLKANHIKIGWVSYRVRRKTEIKLCYRCLSFGNMAANCRGPDRSMCCWRDTLRGPAQGNHGAAPAPQERRNPGMIIFRGQCVARRSERQLQIGGLREAANKVQAGNKVDHRCTANCAHRQ